MRFWVIKAGEPIPFLTSESKDRFLRAGLMCLTLAGRGHQVVWWASQFDHNRKEFRTVETDQPIPAGGNDPDLVFLSSPGYKNNIGFRRLWDHKQIAVRFRALAPTLERPDVIVAAYPIVDLACAAVDFGQAHHIPVVVDIRDLWPDIIYDWLNRRIGRLGLKSDGLLIPYERMARRSFRRADSVIAISQGMLDWAGRFGRPPECRVADRVFYQSKRFVTIDGTARAAEIHSWAERGVDFSQPKTRLVWAGTMTPQSDAATLMVALGRIPERYRCAIEVIICGTGSLADTIKRMANDCVHVVFADWVGQAALSVLLEESHIGLMCYPDRFDFQASIPNKVADYCAAGLRILTNLTGEIARLTAGTGTLIHYPTGDSSALAELLVDIAQDPDRYRTDHAPARDIFNRLFDADKVMDDFADHLESLADEGQETLDARADRAPAG